MPAPRKFVVVMTPSTGGVRVIGPYPTPARASGEGLNKFGPLTFGNPTPWRVVAMENR